MRLPYIQVAAETWEDAAQLSALVGCSEGDAFKLLCDLPRWALGLGLEDEAPTGICESPRAVRLMAAAVGWPLERADELSVALVDIGRVELLSDGGLRVRGMKRYAAAWAKNKRDRDRKATFRAAPEPVRATSSVVRATSARLPADVPRTARGVHPETQTQTQTHIETTATTLSARADRVFSHWCQRLRKNARTTFDAKRRKAVEARLADGYAVEDLCAAIDGCAVTPHNLGQNDRGERYDDLELICRDAAHVDRFRANAASPPVSRGKGPVDPAASQSFFDSLPDDPKERSRLAMEALG